MAAADRAQLKAADLGIGGEMEEEVVLDVLDLPQLYTKPPAHILLATLADLSSEPSSWETTPRPSTTPRSGTSGTSTPLPSLPRTKKPKIRNHGLPRYLTRIIASPLTWITSDYEKEAVWEAASQRLSERSGRTGMGDLSRSFVIPLTVAAEGVVERVLEGEISAAEAVAVAETVGRQEASEEAGMDVDLGVLEVRIHEPALTGDSLGLKTWGSAFLLAKRLAGLRAEGLLPLLAPGDAVLELGAGTGLVGIAAAAVLKTPVWLTDLPAIVPNLARNVEANAAAVAAAASPGAAGGGMQTAVLDWARPAEMLAPATGELVERPPHSFPLLLAADPVYDPEHPALLATAVQYHLSTAAAAARARVVVEMPVREGFEAEREGFRWALEGLGLGVVGEGWETGVDDWSGGGGGGGWENGSAVEVRCWWSVWGWEAGKGGGRGAEQLANR